MKNDARTKVFFIQKKGLKKIFLTTRTVFH